MLFFHCRYDLSSTSFFDRSILPGSELLSQRVFENFAGRILGQRPQKGNPSLI